MKRLNILVSAYACNPLASFQLHPGEDITGWQLVMQLMRFHNLWVIAHSYNERGVKEYVKNYKVSYVKFYFISLPKCFGWLYNISWGQRAYYFLWQILAWRMAVRLNKEVSFDAAHQVTFGNDWVPSFIGAFLKAPFILGPVGGGQRVPYNFLREYPLLKIPSEIFRAIAQWIGRNLLLVRSISINNARAVLVCNHETREKIPKRFLEKVYLFPLNGISEAELNPDITQYSQAREFIVLSAGRLVPLKGLAIGIRAFSNLAKEFKDVRFRIIGDGEEKRRLLKLTESLGLNSKVDFVPWLERTDLLKEMRKCDVFLFPSFRDGGGAVVVEAMASAKPVICINIGGPGFHIQEEWGIKVEPKSPDFVIQEFSSALKELYSNRELRLKLGEAALKRAQDFYLWDRIGDRLEEIYEKTLL